jgi:NRPS condensation-like uncharacterized protein
LVGIAPTFVYFKEIDASDWKEEQIDEKVNGIHLIPFDLEKGPITRIHLFNRLENDNILLFNTHHIVADGWSFWIILHELEQLYLERTKGKKASLAPVHYTYADFVHWQSEMLKGSEGEKHWAYWRKKLSGSLPVPNLPLDYPRPEKETFRGLTLFFEIKNKLAEKIKSTIKEEKITLYTFLLTTFKVMLWQYCKQEDISVCSPFAARTKPEFENIVGFFTNLTAIRSNLSGNPSFKDLLAKVQNNITEAMKHHDYPFPTLIEKLGVEHKSIHLPNFPVRFILQKPQVKTGSDFLKGKKSIVKILWFFLAWFLLCYSAIQQYSGVMQAR